MRQGGPARRLKKDLLRISCLGLVFGIIACFGFFASKPLMEEIFGEDPRKVTIPEEEEKETLEEEGEAQQEAVQTLDQDSFRQMQQSHDGCGSGGGPLCGGDHRCVRGSGLDE